MRYINNILWGPLPFKCTWNMPSYALNWLSSRSCTSTPSSLWIDACLTLPLRRSLATLQLRMSAIFWPLPNANDNRWGLEHRLTKSSQFPLHHNRAVQCPHYCWCCTKPSVQLMLHFPIISQEDPKTLKILCWSKAPPSGELFITFW